MFISSSGIGRISCMTASTNKSIAIMQPVFLPWLGYFEQMALCDEFIFLDDVQYTKNDWRNRNKIRTKTGWMWLTAPVKSASLKLTLREKELANNSNWHRKHLNAIRLNYAPAPFFDDIFAIVASIYDSKPVKLIDLTTPLIVEFAGYLGISTPISFASSIPARHTGPLDRIIDICNARSASIFYTGPAARSYMDLDYLKNGGVEMLFQDYHHPEYMQHQGGFESHMGIIDLLMNHGPHSLEILLSSPTPPELVRSKAAHG